MTDKKKDLMLVISKILEAENRIVALTKTYAYNNQRLYTAYYYLEDAIRHAAKAIMGDDWEVRD